MNKKDWLSDILSPKKEVLIQTIYGYGWSYPENRNKAVTNIEMKEIPNFTISGIELIIGESGEITGGQGSIRDSTCKYNNYDISFSFRYKNTLDKSENYIVINLIIWDAKNDKDRKNFIGGFGQIIID